MNNLEIEERDVAISHYTGCDTKGRGVIVKFAMSDGRHEIAFLASFHVGWLSDRLKLSETHVQALETEAAKREHQVFLASQPDVAQEDWDCAGITVEHVECHPHTNCVVLWLDRSTLGRLTVAMGPVVAAYLKDYFESARPRLIDPDEADTSKRH